jgi:hypothetical protein
MSTRLELSGKWVPVLLGQPETGMGYQTATVILRDGKRFPKTTIVGGIITEVAGYQEIPFEEDEIDEIVVTHEKRTL